MVKKRALRERERERERGTNQQRKKMTNRRKKIGKRDACSMTSIF